MNKMFLTLACLLIISDVQSEVYFRAIDEDGKVLYTDVPVKDAADSEQLNGSTQPTEDGAIPFETKRAIEKFPVTLYVADSCENGCTQARDFLKKRGIPYTEKKLVTVDEIASFKKDSGADQVPVMHIGTDWLIAFLETRWTKALDDAGYPKFAPYGPHAPVKAAPPAEKPKTE